LPPGGPVKRRRSPAERTGTRRRRPGGSMRPGGRSAPGSSVGPQEMTSTIPEAAMRSIPPTVASRSGRPKWWRIQGARRLLRWRSTSVWPRPAPPGPPSPGQEVLRGRPPAPPKTARTGRCAPPPRPPPGFRRTPGAGRQPGSVQASRSWAKGAPPLRESSDTTGPAARAAGSRPPRPPGHRDRRAQELGAIAGPAGGGEEVEHPAVCTQSPRRRHHQPPIAHLSSPWRRSGGSRPG